MEYTLLQGFLMENEEMILRHTGSHPWWHSVA